VELIGKQARSYEQARAAAQEKNKEMIREAILRFGRLEYGWDERQLALPIRPDVLKYTVGWLFRAGVSPLNLAGLGEPHVGMNSYGGIWVIFVCGDRSIIITVPCENVVIVKQRFGAETDQCIESRLPLDFDAMCAEFETIHDWLAGEEEAA
jgi:hypothetical protein